MDDAYNYENVVTLTNDTDKMKFGPQKKWAMENRATGKNGNGKLGNLT